MADTDDSDDSDEWGREELTIPPRKAEEAPSENDDDSYWQQPAAGKHHEGQLHIDKPTLLVTQEKESVPMIIVDMTMYTQDAIHSRADRNSVNDPAAVSALRKTLEKDYERIAKDASLLEDGTVIPCGTSVWKEALSRLRDERLGHYFSPIFPPKTT